MCDVSVVRIYIDNHRLWFITYDRRLEQCKTVVEHFPLSGYVTCEIWWSEDGENNQ